MGTRANPCLTGKLGRTAHVARAARRGIGVQRCLTPVRFVDIAVAVQIVARPRARHAALANTMRMGRCRAGVVARPAVLRVSSELDLATIELARIAIAKPNEACERTSAVRARARLRIRGWTCLATATAVVGRRIRVRLATVIHGPVAVTGAKRTGDQLAHATVASDIARRRGTGRVAGAAVFEAGQDVGLAAIGGVVVTISEPSRTAGILTTLDGGIGRHIGRDVGCHIGRDVGCCIIAPGIGRSGRRSLLVLVKRPSKGAGGANPHHGDDPHECCCSQTCHDFASSARKDESVNDSMAQERAWCSSGQVPSRFAVEKTWATVSSASAM